MIDRLRQRRTVERLLARSPLRGIVVLDEIQRRPDLFPALRWVRSALEDLELTRLDVIHAGSETFPLERRVRAIAARRLLDDLAPLDR